VAFLELVEENSRFGRLTAAGFPAVAGRGLKTVRDLLEKFEESLSAASKPLERFSVEAAVGGAIAVDPQRVAVPEVAGTVLPEDWLLDRQRELFLDPELRRCDDRQGGVPRSCYLVPASVEDDFRMLLLRSGMAVLIPEDRVARLPHSDRLMLSGMFSVAHKPNVDRLIFDRRVANWFERRFGWVHLPLGPMLCLMILEPGEVARGSGDDLRTYFYQLRNSPDSLQYNCFGRRVPGAPPWTDWGACPGVPHRMALRVVGMGDGNAVDIADETHRRILISEGCLDESEELKYGFPFPQGKCLEGCYIDDHFCRRDRTLE